MIAAYVSGLNACSFCHDAHRIHAKAFGISLETIDALMQDPNTPQVDSRLLPLLAHVAKLTRTPTHMTEADAKAVYDAGWGEDALFDAVLVCATFNMMNRILEGTGKTEYSMRPEAADQDMLELRRSKSAYSEFGASLGLDV